MKYAGPTHDLIVEYNHGIRAGMALCGAETIKELRTSTNYVRVSPLSIKESNPQKG